MNAKTELEETLHGKAAIKCAKIKMDEYKNMPEITLRVGHSDSDLLNFFKLLDFEYDNGYGGQELFGTVWLEDNTWLSRGEYDGSEWWIHNALPSIPKDLR